MELIRYDAMCQAIAECERVDEVKDIRDKAMAIEAYAKQAMNTEAERQACNIRLRAERKVGKMLQETERDPGNGGHNRGSGQGDPSVTEYQQAKEGAGISDTQAKRWQKLASVDEKEFESALADPETKPSTSGLIKKANGSSNKMDPAALWLWGYLRDFERENIVATELPKLFGEMTQTMLADIDRISPVIAEFIERVQDERN